jgi:hypothetical protein
MTLAHPNLIYTITIEYQTYQLMTLDHANLIYTKQNTLKYQ